MNSNQTRVVNPNGLDIDSMKACLLKVCLSARVMKDGDSKGVFHDDGRGKSL
jgi:hypothetical protein